MCDGLLLHGGVHDHDHALELAHAHRLHGRGGLDRGLPRLLHAGLAQHEAKAPDLSGVARQLGRVVRHAAEELPHHVLAPALDDFFVAEVECLPAAPVFMRVADESQGRRLSQIYDQQQPPELEQRGGVWHGGQRQRRHPGRGAAAWAGDGRFRYCGLPRRVQA